MYLYERIACTSFQIQSMTINFQSFPLNSPAAVRDDLIDTAYYRSIDLGSGLRHYRDNSTRIASAAFDRKPVYNHKLYDRQIRYYEDNVLGRVFLRARTSNDTPAAGSLVVSLQTVATGDFGVS